MKKKELPFEPPTIHFVSPSYQGYFINGACVKYKSHRIQLLCKDGTILDGISVVFTEDAYLKGIYIKSKIMGEEILINIDGKPVRLRK